MTDRMLVATLAFVAFLGVLTQLALTPLLVAIAADFDVSSALVGQAVTVTFVAGATLGLVAGPIADQYGQRRLLMLGAALAAVSLFISAIAPSYSIFLLSRIPGGLGGAMMAAISIAIASTRLPEAQRRIGIGWIFTAFSAAPVIGFPIMSLIGEFVDWRGSLAALGLGIMLAFPVIRLAVGPDPERSTSPFSLAATLGSYGPILRDRPARMLQLCNFIRTLAAFGIVTYLSVYLMEERGMSLTGVGYVFLFVGLGYFAGTRLGDGRYIPLSLRALQTLTAVVFGVAYATPFVLSLGPVLTTICITLGTIAMAAGFVSLTILISEETPGGASTALMLRQSGFAYGTAAAGAIGGVILALFGFAAFGLFMLVTAVISAVIGHSAPVRVHRDPEPAPAVSD